MTHMPLKCGECGGALRCGGSAGKVQGVRRDGVAVVWVRTQKLHLDFVGCGCGSTEATTAASSGGEALERALQRIQAIRLFRPRRNVRAPCRDFTQCLAVFFAHIIVGEELAEIGPGVTLADGATVVLKHRSVAVGAEVCHRICEVNHQVHLGGSGSAGTQSHIRRIRARCRGPVIRGCILLGDCNAAGKPPFGARLEASALYAIFAKTLDGRAVPSEVVTANVVAMQVRESGENTGDGFLWPVRERVAVNV
jgi:hypothetical protein|mmetsp:Transcript_11791/g.28617  ORF Transcript_11791/g.28617 Transcript_11791/m.28617 type:complete len:252 (+) Transcript_11791:1883-2638(+)